MANIVRFLVTVVLIGLLRQVRPEAIKHEYKKGDPITIYADKVGPYFNPSETYTYYSLPYCRPDSLAEKKPSLSEILNGDRFVVAPYKVNFLVERTFEVLCRKNMTREEVGRFRTAVENDYYTLHYLDDLPMWSFVGELHRGHNYKHDEFKYLIYTHFHFEIFYNGNHVTEVHLRTDPMTANITVDEVVDIEFLYTVTWKETSVSFEDRMQKYTMLAHTPYHLSIQRFSITSSLLAILVLTGCLGVLYVCVLQKDFYKGVNDDEELASNHNETGWKVLHGDVFRYPKYKSFFTAAVGCGLQILTVIMSLILLGCAGVFRPYDHGGSMKTTLVFLYAATCGVSGFAALSLYHRFEGTNWVRTLFLTGCLAFGPPLLAFSFLNYIAATYGTTAALPFSAIMVILLVCVLLALPLLLLGGILGKLFTSKFEPPCRTTDCPREIPSLRWYRGLIPQMLLGGLLPFGVIYVQLYYALASVWGLKMYTLYGVLVIVFSLFIIVIALVSVGLTYFQLAAEDYQWWWRSFLCGGSTGLYVFGYCYVYYMEISNMNSFMQTSFFFGYMACICYGVFLMSGSVAFGASFLFIRYIFSNIKCD